MFWVWDEFSNSAARVLMWFLSVLSGMPWQHNEPSWWCKCILPVCVSNRYKYVWKSIIQKTVEVWPRAHISGQLLSLVNAIWMFLDWEENPYWQRETLRRCYVRPRKGNRMMHKALRKQERKPMLTPSEQLSGLPIVIRGKDPPWQFPLQLLGAFTPQSHLKTISPFCNAKSFRLARHPPCVSPTSTENVR